MVDRWPSRFGSAQVSTQQLGMYLRVHSVARGGVKPSSERHIHVNLLSLLQEPRLMFLSSYPSRDILKIFLCLNKEDCMLHLLKCITAPIFLFIAISNKFEKQEKPPHSRHPNTPDIFHHTYSFPRLFFF